MEEQSCTYISPKCSNRPSHERIAYYNYTGDSREDIPFINETGVNFNVDVSFEAILTVRDEFFAALKEIGIIVELKSRIMDVLILTPKKSIAIR